MSEGAKGEEARAAARRILGLAAWTYALLSCAEGAALAIAYAAPIEGDSADPRARALLPALLVLLFFAATILNLGLKSAARIVAARRYNRENPLPAARVVAASQAAAFAIYALVVAFVVYRRVALGGGAHALVPAGAAILAGLYFLRLPSFLHRTLYAPPGPPEDRA
jgi:hypothetical protein